MRRSRNPVLLLLALALGAACAAGAGPSPRAVPGAALQQPRPSPRPDPALLEAAAALPGPPAPGSDEARADLAIVLWLQRTRTPADVERARSERVTGLATFAAALGPGFDLRRHPGTRAFLDAVQEEVRAPVRAAKERFRRLRPYDADARVTPAIDRERSFAYPSGHATRGAFLARVLMELVPERRDAIREAGLLVGYGRVTGGVHYPSDVLGGQQLGDALADRILARPEIRARLAELRDQEWR